MTDELREEIKALIRKEVARTLGDRLKEAIETILDRREERLSGLMQLTKEMFDERNKIMDAEISQMRDLTRQVSGLVSDVSEAVDRQVGDVLQLSSELADALAFYRNQTTTAEETS